MSCYIHKNKPKVTECQICKKPICEQCQNVQNQYGACPNCMKDSLKYQKQNLKRGLVLNILSVVCFVAFLVVYLVQIFTQHADTLFVVLGAICCAFLGVFSVFLLVRAVLKIKDIAKVSKKMD